MAEAITVPALSINGKVFPIKPNSLKFKEGFGDTMIRIQSLGGSAKQVVSSVDIETQKGMIAATFYTTDVSLDTAKTWAKLNGALTVQFVQSKTSRTLKSGTIVEEPEITTGKEGEFELVFEGAPLV